MGVDRLGRVVQVPRVRALRPEEQQWTSAHVGEFFGDLRAEHHAKPSTLRSHQTTMRLFCEYVTDPGYGWAQVCLDLFGTHPVQVCHEWNTAT